MAKDAQNFYITTAISYVNGSPHLGHAYEGILTDVMARHQRLNGKNVRFLTGTDEHGQKVDKTAKEKGYDHPREFCDKIAAEFQAFGQHIGMSNDDFIRTTEDRHYAASKAIWQAMQDNGDIYLGGYSGWYSIRDERYFAENEIDTAEDGTKFAIETGTEVEWMEQDSYFFRLSAYQDRLLQYFEDNPDFIQPESRRNEVISFVKGGLEDLSISRNNFTWGVPVPGDEGHVMYVWVDALTNYITALGYPETESELYQAFWPADYHVIGKDIIRFHCVYWPAFLMSAGLDLPKAVFAHGFINVDGQKMSKSLGNVVAPQDLIDAYGLDATRYILMREVSHGQDGNFSHEQAVTRINADLANGLGNLAQRSLSMIAKNCDGKLPARYDLDAEDQELLTLCQSDDFIEQFDRFQFNRGLEAVWRKVAAANAYIDAKAPWTLKKTDPDAMGHVLSVLCEAIRMIAISARAVMPDSTDRILDQLAVPSDRREYQHMSEFMSPGTDLPAPEGVFPRIDMARETDAA